MKSLILLFLGIVLAGVFAYMEPRTIWHYITFGLFLVSMILFVFSLFGPTDKNLND